MSLYEKENIISSKQDIIATIVNRQNYSVYVGYADSIYAVTDILWDKDAVYVCSKDTKGAVTKMSAKKLNKILKNIPDMLPWYAEPAENIDTSLDMQLLDEVPITSIGISDLQKDIYLLC